MNYWTGNSFKEGKVGASGARVITVTTTCIFRGADGKEISSESSLSVILLPSGSFLPDSFIAENEAEAALDKYEDSLKRQRRNQLRT